MSKQDKPNEEITGSTPAPTPAPAISREDLAQIVAMVAAAMQAGSTQSTATMAEVLGKSMVSASIEAQNYKSPAVLENERRAKESELETERGKRHNTLVEQSNCPHQKGSRGERAERDNAAFWRFVSDTGLVILICSACQKIIMSDTTDPKEKEYFRWPTSNRQAEGGRRVFNDPLKVQQRGKPIEYKEPVAVAV